MVDVAARVAAGQAAAGAISATAASLSVRVTKNMIATRFLWTAAAALATGVTVGVTVILAAAQQTGGKRLEPAAAVKVTKKDGAATRAGGGTTRVPIAGRVVGPDGKPVSGAVIYVRHSHHSDPVQEGREVERVGETGPEGRFQFDLDPTRSDVAWPSRDGPAWHNVMIAATAPNCGCAWISAGDAARGGAEAAPVG